MSRLPMRSSAVAFRYKGLKLVGVLNRPAGPENARFPAVLFLHGFPGAEKNVDVQRALQALGVASFALYFAGAWGSEGRYTFTGLVPQAAAALRFLRSRPFVDPKRTAVFGFSMGGWTAINLAARAQGLKGAVAVAPVGGGEMIGRHTRSFVARACVTLNVGSLESVARDFAEAVRGADPAKAAASLGCPLLVVHGDADDVVPFPVSRRIKALAPKTELVVARGVRHDFLEKREWLTRLTSRWLLEALKAR